MKICFPFLYYRTPAFYTYLYVKEKRSNRQYEVFAIDDR